MTTPQPAAQQVAVRAAGMAEKVGMRIIGVAENMSYLVGTGQEIFGSGGGQRLADEIGVPLLGSVPLDPALREAADAGTPVLEAAPDSEATAAIVDARGAHPEDAPRHDPQGAHRSLGRNAERAPVGALSSNVPRSLPRSARGLPYESLLQLAERPHGRGRRPPRTSSRRPSCRPGSRPGSRRLGVDGARLRAVLARDGDRGRSRRRAVISPLTSMRPRLRRRRPASRPSVLALVALRLRASPPCRRGRRRRRARRCCCPAPILPSAKFVEPPANVALRLPSTFACFPRDVPMR